MQAAREGKLAQLTSREGRRLASLLAKLGQLEDAHAVAQVLAGFLQKLTLLAVALLRKHAAPPCWVAGVADERMRQELCFASSFYAAVSVLERMLASTLMFGSKHA